MLHFAVMFCVLTMLSTKRQGNASLIAMGRGVFYRIKNFSMLFKIFQFSFFKKTHHDILLHDACF